MGIDKLIAVAATLAVMAASTGQLPRICMRCAWPRLGSFMTRGHRRGEGHCCFRYENKCHTNTAAGISISLLRSPEKRAFLRHCICVPRHLPASDPVARRQGKKRNSIWRGARALLLCYWAGFRMRYLLVVNL